MQVQKKAINDRVERIIGEINNCLDYLYGTQCLNTKYMILYQLKCKIQELQFLNSLAFAEGNQSPSEIPQNVPVQTTFSPEELANYNGKNGNPAYVAVKGTVYDVTNNAAWAAATHFGLNAGKDLSGEFASCHPGQPILNYLRVIGKLVL